MTAFFDPAVQFGFQFETVDGVAAAEASVAAQTVDKSAAPALTAGERPESLPAPAPASVTPPAPPLMAPTGAAKSCGSTGSGRNESQRAVGDRRRTAGAKEAVPSVIRVPSPAMRTRIETDSMGPIEVAADRYWGAQTERSRINFRIGEERMPRPLITALAIVKRAAAEANLELGVLDARRAKAIIAGRRRDHRRQAR